MSSRFYDMPQLFLTSESVTEGHPDKMCDQISDAVLDAMLSQDPMSRVACETTATTGLVLVTGEVTTSAVVDIPRIVRSTVRDIGYTNAAYGFDADTCSVLIALKGQSPDIDMGVSKAWEARVGEMHPDDLEALGAGDQGMMIGFACDETPELMPLPLMLAHQLVRRLAAVRKSRELPYLQPDGKSQVTVEYSYGRPKRVDSIVVSTQHEPDVSTEQLRRDIIEHVVRQVVPEHLLDGTRYFVNPTGRFVFRGPMADAGLTGRKIVVDTYGGIARHGGGAFSGKDPTKVDRSASYAARCVAKTIVAAGLARRCEFQVSYAIGVARPLSTALDTFGTGVVPEDRLLEAVREVFDLRPAAIIRDFRLRRPIYRPTAAYGHFGRTDIDAPWEDTSRAGLLRRALGLSEQSPERLTSLPTTR